MIKNNIKKKSVNNDFKKSEKIVKNFKKYKIWSPNTS